MHITEARGAGLYALGGVVTEPPAPLAESYAYKSIITRTPPRVHERATHEGGAGEEDNREEDRLAEHTWNEVKPPRPRDRERRDREREILSRDARTAVADAHIRAESGEQRGFLARHAGTADYLPCLITLESVGKQKRRILPRRGPLMLVPPS